MVPLQVDLSLDDRATGRESVLQHPGRFGEVGARREAGNHCGGLVVPSGFDTDPYAGGLSVERRQDLVELVATHDSGISSRPAAPWPLPPSVRPAGILADGGFVVIGGFDSEQDRFRRADAAGDNRGLRYLGGGGRGA